MFSSRIRMVAALFGFSLLLGACGEEWNANQFFVSDAQKDSLVSLIEDAQIAFDAGEYKKALEYAEKAEKISPDNEQVAVLLGYINLSLSGMDTFSIARGLIDANDDDDDEDNENEEGSELIASSGRATKFFDKLTAVLNLDIEELQKFGELSSEEDLDAFAPFDVILPVSAIEARALATAEDAADRVQVMKYINTAIAKICPFVDEDLRIPDSDERHNEDNCPTTTTLRERQVVSHFLWAFVHIAEAVVFYSVVQYQEAENNDAHINLRANALEEDAGSLSVASYAAHAVNLADSMTQIYAVDDPDSQFSALVNNIAVAADTFTAIGQMPTKIKQSLTRAVDSINDKKSEVSGGSDTEQQNNSFKNQINDEIAEDMADQIDDYAQNDPDDFNSNRDELCGSYDTVSGGANIPEPCND